MSVAAAAAAGWPRAGPDIPSFVPRQERMQCTS